MFRFCFAMLALLWAQLAHADPFTVAGVPVDARAPNAIQAQTDAILDGQTRAADILLRRLTVADNRGASNYVPPTSEEATRMIRAMGVANEKRSSDRYIGDITVAFVPGRVQDYARAKGLRLLTTTARERVAIPVSGGVLVGAEHPLAMALADPALGYGLAPAKVANTGILRAAGVRGSDLVAGNTDALKAAAAALGSPQLLIVDGSPSRASLYDAATDAETFQPLGAVSARRDGYLALAIADKLTEDWKRANAGVVTADPGSVSVMRVTVAYDSLRQWKQLQRAIAGAARIRGSRLVSLRNSRAVMELQYVGDSAQLASELRGKGADLRNDPGYGTVITVPGYRLAEAE